MLPVVVLTLLLAASVTGQCPADVQCLTTCPGNICQNCKVFFGVNSTTGKCDACNLQPNCLLCNVTTKCQTCATTGGPSGPNLGGPGCSACISQCAVCTVAGGGKCDRCNTGYNYDSASNTCVKCALEFCATCPSGCTSCITGYTFVKPAGTDVCNKCSANCTYCSGGADTCDFGRCTVGFGSVNPNSSTTCAACTATNCRRCDFNATAAVDPTSGRCTTCNTGYTLQPDGTCKHVCTTLPYCDVCLANPQRCTDCKEPYGVNTATGVCQLCTDKTGCSRCDNLTLCTRCTNVDTDGPAKNGSGTCAPCGSSCWDCTINGAAKCDQCKEGYYLDAATMTCMACTLLNCGTCTATTCTKCATGYVLTGSTCSACAPNCSFCFTNGANKCDSARYCDALFTFNAGTMKCDATRVSFIRWGRTVCPNGSLELYKGYMAGSYYNMGGSGANYLCMNEIPQFPNEMPGRQGSAGMIHGVEFELIDTYEYLFTKENIPGGVLNFQDVPCVRCYVEGSSDLMMMPGRQDCASTGYNLMYKGYLMSEAHADRGRSEFVCVDSAPEGRPGGGAKNGQGLLYPVEVGCGSLPCDRYKDGSEASCAVCTI